MILYILLFGLALTNAVYGGVSKQHGSRSDSINRVQIGDWAYDNTNVEPQPIGQERTTSRFVPALLANQPQVPSGQNTNLDILRNQIAEQSVNPPTYGTAIPQQQIIYQRTGGFSVDEMVLPYPYLYKQESLEELLQEGLARANSEFVPVKDKKAKHYMQEYKVRFKEPFTPKNPPKPPRKKKE